MRGFLSVAPAILALLCATAGDASAAPLHRCGFAIRCGRVTVPLDRGGSVPGRIRLYVERVRSGRGARRGVMIALAGGPGQANTDFTTAFDDELVHPGRDIVSFDQRGTGRSGRIRCRALQRRRSRANLARCANQLGSRRPFYRTLDSVEDLDAVRAALGVGKISLYGVSYGTRVALEYAYRHPDRVDRLILDSVLPLNGPDPFERETFGALPRAYDAICSPSCPFIEGRPYDRLAELVRRGPVRGRYFDRRGRPHRANLTAARMSDLLIGTDVDPLLHAQLPGAVESAARGDSAPLLRLRRRAQAQDSGLGVSWGLFFATVCEESDFPWDRGAPPAERLRQGREAFASVPDSVYAPFPRDAVFHESLGGCARWPMAPARPPLPTGPAPDVPTLLMAGAQDLRTPLENAQAVAADLPNAQLVTVPQAGHAVIGTACATRSMRAFMADRPLPECRPRLSDAPDPPAPTSLGQLDPIGAPGHAGRTAAAVLATVNDAGEQIESLFSFSRLGGLRGGWFAGGFASFRFHRLEYVPGVRVSGALGLAGRTLRITGPRAAHGRLRLAGKRLVGRLGGRHVSVPVLSTRAARPPLGRRPVLVR